MTTGATPPQREWEALLDPYGLRRLWAGQADDARDGTPSDPLAFPRELAQTVLVRSRGAGEMGLGLAGLVFRLAGAAGRASQEVLTHRPVATEPVELFRRWYDAAAGPLGEIVDDALENEKLLRTAKRLSDRQTALDKAFRAAAERYFSRLQLATASDAERIARLVVNLDDKLDRLEDELERAEPGADAERLLDRLDRLDRLEAKVDRLLAAAEAEQTVRVP